MQTKTLPDGRTLKIVEYITKPEVPERGIWYYRSSSVHPDNVVQLFITNETLLQHVGHIPDVGEVFVLPFYVSGTSCQRIDDAQRGD